VRCADLRRSESEPGWPRRLAQLGTPRPGQVDPCDTPLALLAVAHTVHSALSLLDGDEPPALGAVLSLDPLSGTATRTRIDAHASCTCGAAAPGGPERRGYPALGDFVRADLLE
jgi:hypothetical protein